MGARERSYIFRFHVFQRHCCLRNGACPVAGFGCNSDTRVHLVAKRVAEWEGVERPGCKRLTKSIADIGPDAGLEVGGCFHYAGLEASLARAIRRSWWHLRFATIIVVHKTRRAANRASTDPKMHDHCDINAPAVATSSVPKPAL